MDSRKLLASEKSAHNPMLLAYDVELTDTKEARKVDYFIAEDGQHFESAVQQQLQKLSSKLADVQVSRSQGTKLER